ncbi:MAG: hypothetical protein ABSB86_18840, partial [Bryobacteraceae bacterium]
GNKYWKSSCSNPAFAQNHIAVDGATFAANFAICFQARGAGLLFPISQAVADIRVTPQACANFS